MQPDLTRDGLGRVRNHRSSVTNGGLLVYTVDVGKCTSHMILEYSAMTNGGHKTGDSLVTASSHTAFYHTRWRKLTCIKLVCQPQMQRISPTRWI